MSKAKQILKAGGDTAGDNGSNAGVHGKQAARPAHHAGAFAGCQDHDWIRFGEPREITINLPYSQLSVVTQPAYCWLCRAETELPAHSIKG